MKATRIAARLTTDAANALDTALGTAVFTPGMKIATVSTQCGFSNRIGQLAAAPARDAIPGRRWPRFVSGAPSLIPACQAARR